MQGPVIEDELRRREEARARARADEIRDARRRAADAAIARADRAGLGTAEPPPPPPPAAPARPAEPPAPEPVAEGLFEEPQAQLRHRRVAAGDEGETPPPEETEGDEPATRMCRICHCGDEGGQLIAPCLCSGTLGLVRFGHDLCDAALHTAFPTPLPTPQVHLACLNEWRAAAPSPSALERCDVCGYRYSVQRADWARYATDPRVTLIVSAAILILAVVACGAAGALLPLRLADRFYALVLWHPPWRSSAEAAAGLARVLDALVVGGAVVGLAGSASAAVQWYHRDRDWFFRAVAPSAFVCFTEAGSPALRLYVVGGLWLGFCTLLPVRGQQYPIAPGRSDDRNPQCRGSCRFAIIHLNQDISLNRITCLWWPPFIRRCKPLPVQCCFALERGCLRCRGNRGWQLHVRGGEDDDQPLQAMLLHSASLAHLREGVADGATIIAIITHY